MSDVRLVVESIHMSSERRTVGKEAVSLSRCVVMICRLCMARHWGCRFVIVGQHEGPSLELYR